MFDQHRQSQRKLHFVIGTKNDFITTILLGCQLLRKYRVYNNTLPHSGLSPTPKLFPTAEFHVYTKCAFPYQSG